MNNLQRLAQYFSSMMTTGTRTESREQYRLFKDDRPDWMSEVMRQVHVSQGDFMPSDCIYNAVYYLIDIIEENEEDSFYGESGNASWNLSDNELSLILEGYTHYIDDVLQEEVARTYWDLIKYANGRLFADVIFSLAYQLTEVLEHNDFWAYDEDDLTDDQMSKFEYYN